MAGLGCHMRGYTCDGPVDSVDHPQENSKLKADLFHNSERAASSARGPGALKGASWTEFVVKSAGSPEVPACLPDLGKEGGGGAERGQSKSGVFLYSINNTQLTKEVVKGRSFSAKAIISGDHVEVYEYARPQTSAKPGKRSSGPKGSCRERGDNVHRAYSQVKRLVNANFGRWGEKEKFLTLTRADNLEDIEQANRDFHNFIKKLRYHISHDSKERYYRPDRPFQYVAVPEIQHERYEKYGVKVIHHHVVFFGLPYIDVRKLAEWWGHGFVWIVDSSKYEDNPGQYLAKYIGKDFSETEFKGHRRFFTTQRLRRSEERRAQSVGEILEGLRIGHECLTFEQEYMNNPYVGLVHYRHYDLRRRADGTKHTDSKAKLKARNGEMLSSERRD